MGHGGAEWFEEQGNKSCKKDEKSNRRCMIDDGINDCDCERLQDDFNVLRTKYQEHLRRSYDDYRIGIKEAFKTDPKSFFEYVELKKKRVDNPSVMSFVDQPASGSQDICDILRNLSSERMWMTHGFCQVQCRIL
jgi:hypothetical protein